MGMGALSKNIKQNKQSSSTFLNIMMIENVDDYDDDEQQQDKNSSSSSSLATLQELVERFDYKKRHSNVLDLINFELSIVDDEQDRISLFNLRGNYYCIKAECLKEEFNLEYFRNFRRALNSYNEAQNIEKSNVIAILGIAKCLLKLHQNKGALDYLNKIYARYKNNLQNYGDFWVYYGMAYRKCAKIWADLCDEKSKMDDHNLKNARYCFNRAYELIPDHPLLEKEIQINDSLQDLQYLYQRKFNYFIELKKQLKKRYTTKKPRKVTTLNSIDAGALFYVENEEPVPIDGSSYVKKYYTLLDQTKSNRSNDREKFKIISVDAGGLRGVISGVVLCEIEKRCNTYLSNVVDMFAGTSTGSIVAGLYTVPSSKFLQTPSRCAAEIIDLSLTFGKKIFSKPSNMRQLFTEKYSDENKLEIFKNWFGDTRLSESLCELVIPTFHNSGPLRTEYMTRYNARNSPDKNFTYVDAIMASTAAPTYFPPYFIDNHGYFLDGAMTTCNPSQKAYEEAVYRLDKQNDDIFVLSLGTGHLASELFEKDLSSAKGLLYWASNIPQIMMSGQIHNTDIFMNEKLGDRYKRWEFYLENEIAMDNLDQVSELIEIGTQFIEERHDDINKVVEIFME